MGPGPGRGLQRAGAPPALQGASPGRGCWTRKELAEGGERAACGPAGGGLAASTEDEGSEMCPQQNPGGL